MAKDLSKYYTRESLRIVSCKRNAAPMIEELALQYLDKTERLRTQAEAVRELLGKTFQMKPYPPQLRRPHLAVWGNATVCVVAQKHPQAGMQSLADAELMAVAQEVGEHPTLFFA
jgi:hypothetical protein